MRKVLLCLMAVLGFAFASQAQEPAKKVVKTTKTVKKNEVPAVVEQKKVEKKVTKEGVVLKKDGTPDKRYKSKEKVVLKKDGTPDRRYKVNKTN
jgi:uncharacterized protein (DUF2147 family)